MNAGPVWDLLLLGASFWWVYVLDLVHPVDGLLALVYPSMCIYFLNNVPSTFCSNAMKWILLYDCYFWTVGCAFLSVLLLHDYSTILNAPGLLTDNSCLPPGLVMIPVFTVVFWLSCPLYTMGTTGLSISCDYFCPFFVTGLQYLHSFMLGCLVQNNVAPFLVEQLVLCTPG